MKQHQEKIGNMLNFLNTVLFIIIIGFCSAQKPMVQLIVSPKVAQVGEEVSVTVKTNILGKVNFNLPVGFVKGNQEVESSEIEPDFNTGKMSYSYYKTINGCFTKEGEYIMGPAYVSTKGRANGSNVVTVKIEKEKLTVSDEISLSQLKKPAFGILSKSKSKIYEGEPVILHSKVYSHFYPTEIGSYSPSEISGAIEKHDILSTHNITVERKVVKGYQMFFFEHEKQVIFPLGNDKIAIKPFKMQLKNGFDGYVLNSNGLFIEVVPLPSNAPADFLGGVGEFTIKRTINKTVFKKGDFMVMTIVVSGEGNIHQSSMPKLNLPNGMVLYGDPIVVEDFSFGNTGSKGKITYTFNIQLLKSGKLIMPPFSLSYFDVSKEKYITITDVEENINVKSNSNFSVKQIPISNIESDSLNNVSPVSSNNSESGNGFFKSPVLLVSIFSLLSFLFLLFKMKKKKVVDEKEEELKYIISKEEILTEIKLAESYLIQSKSNQFYSSIQKSLFLICSFELKADVTLLNKADIFKSLLEKKLSAEILKELEDAFKLCEEARYGLIYDITVQQNLLENTKNIISKMN